MAAEEQLRVDDEYELLMRPVGKIFPNLREVEDEDFVEEQKSRLNDKAEMWYKKLVAGEKEKDFKHKKHVVKIETESYSVPEPRLTEKQRLVFILL